MSDPWFNKLRERVHQVSAARLDAGKGESEVERSASRTLAAINTVESFAQQYAPESLPFLETLTDAQELARAAQALKVNLEPAVEAKLLGFVDGLTANLTIIKDEYERVLCLFQQANKAKRKYFANWKAAAAENRRLVGMEQDAQHYKEEMEDAQADARELARYLIRVTYIGMDGRRYMVNSTRNDELAQAIDKVLTEHGAKYLPQEEGR